MIDEEWSELTHQVKYETTPIFPLKRNSDDDIRHCFQGSEAISWVKWRENLVVTPHLLVSLLFFLFESLDDVKAKAPAKTHFPTAHHHIPPKHLNSRRRHRAPKQTSTPCTQPAPRRCRTPSALKYFSDSDIFPDRDY
ncbi:hypothetical protein V6N11_077059 [Hibiscus sabdariffa]|uniref:Uncharacterized protein n=1 Tax=Hibiscus sabdariffa TaxID=183260 RepID=A0ABR2TBY3_9ROSI